MCVAIVVPADKQLPALDVLSACERANSDGGGVAWTENGVVHWVKGLKLTAQQVVEILAGKAPPYFIHFRISTVGGKNDMLCHPFPVSVRCENGLEGVAPVVLMHNGHWNNWRDVTIQKYMSRQPFPGGEWSDSRAMALLAAQYGTSILEMVNEKVAILRGSGAIEYYGSGWTEKDGVYFSNTNWDRRYYGSGGGTYYGGGYDWREEAKEKKSRKSKYLKDETDPFEVLEVGGSVYLDYGDRMCEVIGNGSRMYLNPREAAAIRRRANDAADKVAIAEAWAKATGDTETVAAAVQTDLIVVNGGAANGANGHCKK